VDTVQGRSGYKEVHVITTVQDTEQNMEWIQRKVRSLYNLDMECIKSEGSGTDRVQDSTVVHTVQDII
jgi:hypothetical protein